MNDEEGFGIFDPETITVSDDRIRATAQIPFSDTGDSLLATINNFPLSIKMQTGLKQLVTSFMSRDSIFAHNASVTGLMRAYDISAITLDFVKSPNDAECVELPPFLRNLRFLVGARATRTVGETSPKDERALQYNPTQRIEQVNITKEPTLQELEEQETM